MHRPDLIKFGDLVPTPTCAFRMWFWVPADPLSPRWDGRCGTLVIVQGASREYGTVRDPDEYAVEEVRNQGRGGRQFLLLSLTDPDQEQPYEVFLGDGVLPPRCSCKAGRARAPHDKHREALAAVVAAGGVPAPFPPEVTCDHCYRDDVV